MLAMTRPPQLWRMTAAHSNQDQPWKTPSLAILSPSFETAKTSATKLEIALLWRLVSQI